MSKPEEAGASAPKHDSERGRTALLIVDMINDLKFAQSGALRRGAVQASEAISRLRDAAEARDVPVIFVNDNFGQWHSDKNRLVDHAIEAGGEAKVIAGRLRPRADDYFIIKPQFSGFYATNLPVLLPKLGISRLILTGLATDICILFTAADAHMRDYELWVPDNAVAGTNAERHRWALELMRQSMGAEIETGDAGLIDKWMGEA